MASLELYSQGTNKMTIKTVDSVFCYFLNTKIEMMPYRSCPFSSLPKILSESREIKVHLFYLFFSLKKVLKAFIKTFSQYALANNFV